METKINAQNVAAFLKKEKSKPRQPILRPSQLIPYFYYHHYFKNFLRV